MVGGLQRQAFFVSCSIPKPRKPEKYVWEVYQNTSTAIGEVIRFIIMTARDTTPGQEA